LVPRVSRAAAAEAEALSGRLHPHSHDSDSHRLHCGSLRRSDRQAAGPLVLGPVLVVECPCRTPCSNAHSLQDEPVAAAVLTLQLDQTVAMQWCPSRGRSALQMPVGRPVLGAQQKHRKNSVIRQRRLSNLRLPGQDRHLLESGTRSDTTSARSCRSGERGSKPPQ